MPQFTTVTKDRTQENEKDVKGMLLARGCIIELNVLIGVQGRSSLQACMVNPKYTNFPKDRKLGATNGRDSATGKQQSKEKEKRQKKY